METQNSIVAFKGFDANLRCRDFQYEIGASYVHEGPVVRCTKEGFHACENPLDVFSYYSPHESRYCSVEVSGEISRDGSDSKIAAAKLTVVAEIGIPGIVTSFVKWVMDRIDASLSQTNTGDMSASTNTGYMSASTNTGDRSASTVSGKASVAMAIGSESKARASEGSAIVIVSRADDCSLLHIFASKVGENGIKADTFYMLDKCGVPKEVE